MLPQSRTLEGLQPVRAGIMLAKGKAPKVPAACAKARSPPSAGTECWTVKAYESTDGTGEYKMQ